MKLKFDDYNWKVISPRKRSKVKIGNKSYPVIYADDNPSPVAG